VIVSGIADMLASLSLRDVWNKTCHLQIAGPAQYPLLHELITDLEFTLAGPIPDASSGDINFPHSYRLLVYHTL
jgi:hypothetical protein